MTKDKASDSGPDARRRALGLLARATVEDLAGPLERFWPDVSPRDLRPADTGLVMLRGRAGGDGAPFNLGEATVSRAVVELPTGERGFGHLLGRDIDHARRIATLDALWQRADERALLDMQVLGPIAARLTDLIPRGVEAKLGDAVAGQVDAIFGGRTCDEPQGAAAFDKLAGTLWSVGDFPARVQISVRQSKVPNAFAIPGDRVYVLSALIDKADNADELAGVIAHEYGHVAHRDGLREMISSGGSAFLFGLLLGDVTGSGAVLIASRTMLNAAHSREAEANADAFAARTMLRLGRSPAPLGEFLLRMTGQQQGGAMALLASHPLTQDRLAELKRLDAHVTAAPLLTDGEWKALKGICGK